MGTPLIQGFASLVGNTDTTNNGTLATLSPTLAPSLAPNTSTATNVVVVDVIPSTLTAVPTFAPPGVVVALCTGLSYQLSNLDLTAHEILTGEGGNTLKRGLETAAATIVREFVQDFNNNDEGNDEDSNDRRSVLRGSDAVRGQNNGRSLRTQRGSVVERQLLSLAYSADYPPTVTAVVDISAFCASPICVVVKQNVCLVLQDNVDDDEKDTVLHAFRLSLKEAISSGRLVQAVPKEDLPP